MCYVVEHIHLHTYAELVCNLATMFVNYLFWCGRATRLLLYSLFGRGCLRHSLMPAIIVIAVCLFT